MSPSFCQLAVPFYSTQHLVCYIMLLLIGTQRTGTNTGTYMHMYLPGQRQSKSGSIIRSTAVAVSAAENLVCFAGAGKESWGARDLDVLVYVSGIDTCIKGFDAWNSR